MYISAQEQFALGLSCGQPVSGKKHKPDLEFYSALLVGRPVSRCMPVAKQPLWLLLVKGMYRHANEASERGLARVPGVPPRLEIPLYPKALPEPTTRSSGLPTGHPQEGDERGPGGRPESPGFPPRLKFPCTRRHCPSRRHHYGCSTGNAEGHAHAETQARSRVLFGIACRSACVQLLAWGQTTTVASSGKKACQLLVAHLMATWLTLVALTRPERFQARTQQGLPSNVW